MILLLPRMSWALWIIYTSVVNNISYSNIIVWLVTLPLALYGLKDKRFAHVDIGVVMLFVFSIIVHMLGFVMVPSLLGIDKLFHFAAGVLLAFSTLHLTNLKSPYNVLLAGAMATAIGGLWEVFEWLLAIFFDNHLLSISAYHDSMLDIITVALGAAVVIIFSLANKQRTH